jgi:hypothetical protein
MNDIKVLGIDLAKDVFQLHGTDAKGHRVLTKRLSRGKLTEYIAICYALFSWHRSMYFGLSRTPITVLLERLIKLIMVIF